MSFEDRINNIGTTTVSIPGGTERTFSCTYHYISNIGSLVIRDGRDGNVASFPSGGWDACVTR